MTDMTVEHAMQLADLLYRAGYDARHKERDYDPRGCDAWQDVVEALTAPSVDAERMAWLATGGCVDGFVDADMLRGLRRLVDAAIDQARGKGVQDEA